MQGKFWGMFDLIYSNQKDWSDLPDAHDILDGYAQKLNLDMTKFKADIDSDAVKKVVAADMAEGQTIGIDATPTFFINGKAIVNPQNYDAFKALIEAAASGSSN